MKILVLGLGNVGSLICKELYVNNHVIFAADMSRKNCDKLLESNKSITKNEVICTDINDYSIEILIKQFEPDLVINALPGSVGFKVSKSIIENKCNLVDISFSPEDSFELKELANKNKVFAAFDCGISPGFSNMILGNAEKKHKEIDNFICYVGGLPIDPNCPFSYKATFSLSDVLEEYTRSARFIRDGEIISQNPMKEYCEVSLKIPMDNHGIELDAFYSDGLRTALKGRKTKNITEMTLRHPGHLNQIKGLVDSGLLDQTKTILGKTHFDLTKEMLKDSWTFKEDEYDMTIMEVGYDIPDQNKIHVMTLFDQQKTNGESSMARTTGFTCCAVVEAFKNNFFEKRFYTPEEIGENCYQFVEDYLKEKGIHISWSTEEIYWY